MPISKSFTSDTISADSGFDDSQNFKYSYTGSFDQNGFRKGYGCQNWNGPFHKYAGKFLYNNMHDKGFYFIRHEDGLSFYDGQFYNNKLEGYGQVIYNDGSIYEGLFKNNKRFGPGVVTYPDGAQDVGLWNGNSLTRLSTVVSSQFVSSLCSTHTSKLKLLRFKKLVPALPKRDDTAKVLMQKLGTGEEPMQKYFELYNPHIREEHSLFFDRRLYDFDQLGSEDSFIEVLEDEYLEELYSAESLAEDSECSCMNERCIQLNKQIDEIYFELKKIRETKVTYEKQLKKCAKCCKIDDSVEHGDSVLPSVDLCFKSEFGNYRSTENLRPISGTDFAGGYLSKSQDEKNAERFTTKPRFRYVTEASNTDVAHMHQMNKERNFEEEFVNDISENEIVSRSVESIEDIEQEETFRNTFEEYTCICEDPERVNTEFLISELERLRKNEIFFQTVIDFLNEVFYKEVTSTKKSSKEAKAVKIHVENLLAWNNEKLSIEILQHCFRYRNCEEILNFNVKSMLIGDRAIFGKEGEQEKLSVDFLKHCGNNQLHEVKIDLLKHKIDPNLSDARGNTGLHIAVSEDRYEIIQQLANIGANLNAFNDECLTPLLLSILRYIAVVHRVDSWERAFLPEIHLNFEEQEKIIQWRPHKSLVCIEEFMNSSSNLLHVDHDLPVASKKGFEEISVKISNHLKSAKYNQNPSSMDLNAVCSTPFVEDYIKYKKLTALKNQEEVDIELLVTIKKTISILLHYGADPNIGEVPLSPLLLAVFSKSAEIVNNLLKSDANCEIVTEDGLSALHILASLPFSLEHVRMLKYLLEYSCNPNMKSKPDFWIQQNDELIGNYLSPLGNDERNEGKTPLQMIFIRKDFDEDNVDYQCDLARMLIEHGAAADQYYMGHTLLSLAVLRGNMRLIDTILPHVNQNQPLGERMGNALTVLGLNRFPSIAFFSKSKIIIDKLISSGINPFNCIYEFPNIFEFFYNDYSEDISNYSPKLRAASEVEYNNLRKLIFSRDQDFIANSNKLCVVYMREIGRKILTRTYQYQAMQYLILFAEEDLLNHKCLVNMAKMLTIEEALDCIKVLIYCKRIHFDTFYKKLILQVLKYIEDSAPKPKRHKQKVPPIDKFPLLLEKELEKLEHKFEIPTYITRYVLDSEPEKYEVCFHCLRKTVTKLVCCPCCSTVKFCSRICNKFNNKLSTIHPCKLLFCNGKEIVFNFPNGSEITQPPRIDLILYEARQIRENMKQAEAMKIQAEEEDKLKFLSKKTVHKSQRTESQKSLETIKSKSKSFLEKSTSVGFIIEEVFRGNVEERLKSRTNSKTSFSSYVGGKATTLKPRIINCGFHCGQVLPDLRLSAEGNIIPEQEFCVCYPLRKRSSDMQYDTTEAIDEIEFPKGQLLDEIVRRKQDRKSEQYSLSEIFGGALKERRRRENEQLNIFIDSFEKGDTVFDMDREIESAVQCSMASISKDELEKPKKREKASKRGKNKGNRKDERDAGSIKNGNVETKGSDGIKKLTNGKSSRKEPKSENEGKTNGKVERRDYRTAKVDGNRSIDKLNKNQDQMTDAADKNEKTETKKKEKEKSIGVAINRKQIEKQNVGAGSKKNEEKKLSEIESEKALIRDNKGSKNESALSMESKMRRKTYGKKKNESATKLGRIRKRTDRETQTQSSDRIETMKNGHKHMEEKSVEGFGRGDKRTKDKGNKNHIGAVDESQRSKKMKKDKLKKSNEEGIEDREDKSLGVSSRGGKFKINNKDKNYIGDVDEFRKSKIMKKKMLRKSREEGIKLAKLKKGTRRETKTESSDITQTSKRRAKRTMDLTERDSGKHEKTITKLKKLGKKWTSERIPPRISRKSENEASRGGSKIGNAKHKKENKKENKKEILRREKDKKEIEKQLKKMKQKNLENVIAKKKKEELLKTKIPKKQIKKKKDHNERSPILSHLEHQKDVKKLKDESANIFKGKKLDKKPVPYTLPKISNHKTGRIFIGPKSVGPKSVGRIGQLPNLSFTKIIRGRDECDDFITAMRTLKSKVVNPDVLSPLSSNNLRQNKRLSKVFQYFLEVVSTCFPDLDLSCLLIPFACFADGQLYYKFSDPFPYYCQTYSTI